jgi:hypothetical protein
MGPVSLKLYDKFGFILRIETTVNDLTFFKHYREVEHRDGTKEIKWASMQKTIYSLPALRELLADANRRYLEFLSSIEDPRNGRDKLDKLSQPVHNEGRSYPGFNLFDPDDEALLLGIARGVFEESEPPRASVAFAAAYLRRSAPAHVVSRWSGCSFFAAPPRRISGASEPHSDVPLSDGHTRVAERRSIDV